MSVMFGAHPSGEPDGRFRGPPVLVFRHEKPGRVPLAFAFPRPPSPPDGIGAELVAHHVELPALIHRLTPVDGVDLVLPFGEVCGLLAQQITAPERLQPRHRLPCKADVFATSGDAPWAAVVQAVHGDTEDVAAVARLTPGLADRLGLEAYLASPGPVVSLLVTEDPTARLGMPMAAQPPAQPATGPNRIPSHYRNECDFLRSRKEAKAAVRTARRRSRSWVGRVWAWLSKSRLQKDRETWRRRIAGRPLDQQLWGVRPTGRLLVDASTRRWVKRALAIGGYEVDRMLREWEIHWRRKGV
jgi:hypothetical protein